VKVAEQVKDVQAGVYHSADCFPLDPLRSTCPTPVPGDVTPPAITLAEPTSAVLVSSLP